MGRPAGSRNKPKNGNGEDHAEKPAKNGKGHNSSLTDDEQRALTLHHMRLYAAADALVEKAKGERQMVGDQARADLGKGAVKDIKDLIAAGDEKKVKAAIERSMRLARWAGVPINFQLDMFADREPAEEKWAKDGKHAGMSGDVCQPPGHLPTSAHNTWISAWHDGQAILAGAFAKRDPKVPDVPPIPDHGNLKNMHL